MWGVCQPEPKFLAIFTNFDARRLSVITDISGNSFRFKCESLFGQSRNPWRSFPIWMRGVSRSEPKFLEVFPSWSSRRLSVEAKIPGCLYHFDREVCSGHNQNSWRFLPVRFRGVFRSKPKFAAVFSSANARCYSVRTKTPGNSNQFVCEAFFSQNRNS